MTKIIWTKENLEYLKMHGPTEKVMNMARAIGCSSETIYLKLNELRIIRVRTVGKHKATDQQTKHALAAMDRLNEERRVPWPQITTTMGMAMDGRTFGGDPAKPGTAKPKHVRTRWVGDIGEAKSSMGNR